MSEELEEVEELPEDGLPALLEEFLDEADPLVTELDAAAEQMQTAFLAVLRFFGEEDQESEQFFGTLEAAQGFHRAAMIAVHDTLLVGVLESHTGLAKDAHCTINGNAPMFQQNLAQIRTFQAVHHKKRLMTDDAELIDGDDIGMIE